MIIFVIIGFVVMLIVLLITAQYNSIKQEEKKKADAKKEQNKKIDVASGTSNIGFQSILNPWRPFNYRRVIDTDELLGRRKPKYKKRIIKYKKKKPHKYYRSKPRYKKKIIEIDGSNTNSNSNSSSNTNTETEIVKIRKIRKRY